MPVSYPENPVSIGEHIRKKRMELKLLQRDVARICGVTEDCITNWEKNRSAPQIQFFPRIIDFLGYLPFEVNLTSRSGRLKAYRYMNGLSHKRMGKMLDVNATTIGAWENEGKKPLQTALKKLEMLLNKDNLRLTGKEFCR